MTGSILILWSIFVYSFQIKYLFTQHLNNQEDATHKQFLTGLNFVFLLSQTIF